LDCLASLGLEDREAYTLASCVVVELHTHFGSCIAEVAATSPNTDKFLVFHEHTRMFALDYQNFVFELLVIPITETQFPMVENY